MIVIYKRIERQSFFTPKEGAKYAYFLAKLCQMLGLGSLRFFIKPIPSVYFNVGEIDFLLFCLVQLVEFFKLNKEQVDCSKFGQNVI